MLEKRGYQIPGSCLSDCEVLVDSTDLNISILCEEVLENFRNATPCFMLNVRRKVDRTAAISLCKRLSPANVIEKLDGDVHLSP
jgi:hypothetical protein